MTSFDSVLIANRGEIALRIMRSARKLGLGCIAVYSEVDRDAAHVRAADAAVLLGGAAPAESYLNIPAIIAAAQRSGAGAVHPGYGFLAENAGFARAVVEAGLVFIGPAAETVAQMGDKAAAKAIARQAGLPCLDGHEGDQSEAAFAAAAARIGYPVMVKAAAGGGGRGMRLVQQAEELPAALATARSEAERAFGDGTLLLEQAVPQPRHVEIQVLADAHGKVLHLGERDCSVQRRHQKLIEEGPVLPAALRSSMGEAATMLARAVGYVGAGTVEFLLAPDGRFVFIEMNTRLQVEHAVTEALTGIDLVEWQLRIAMGESLPFTQNDIRFQGHAIEARLCAEDPAQGFAPQSGRVLRWQPPAGIRTDHALSDGAVIPPHYDTMVAKLVAHGATRDEARRKLAAALDGTVLLGLPNNRAFLAGCLRHADFAAGPPDTGFIARHDAALLEAAAPASDVIALAALLLAGITPATAPDPMATPGRFQALRHGDAVHELPIAHAGGTWRCGDHQLRLLPGPQDGTMLVEADGLSAVAHHAMRGDTLLLHWRGQDWRFTRHGFAGTTQGDQQDGAIRAPFAGMVASVAVAQGAEVRRGDTLLVLEAMKVQTRLTAPWDGVVTELPAAGRRDVAAGSLLAVVTPLPPSA